MGKGFSDRFQKIDYGQDGNQIAYPGEQECGEHGHVKVKHRQRDGPSELEYGKHAHDQDNELPVQLEIIQKFHKIVQHLSLLQPTHPTPAYPPHPCQQGWGWMGLICPQHNIRILS